MRSCNLYGSEKNFRKLSACAKSRAGVYLDDITSSKHYLISLWICRIIFCPPIRPKIGTDFFAKYGTGQRHMKIMLIYWPNFSKVIQHWSYCRQNRFDMEKLHRILKNGYIWNHFLKKHVFETDYSFSKCWKYDNITTLARETILVLRYSMPRLIFLLRNLTKSLVFA